MSDELPPGWVWKTIAEVATRATASITDGPFGSNLKSEHYTDSGARVVRLQNIGEGLFLDAEAYISLEHFERLSKHAVEAGDVLVAMLGEVLPRACIAPMSLGLAIVKADCVRVRIDTSIALRAYVMYALNCDQTRRLAATIVHGVGRPRLNLGELKGLRLPIAPLGEQARIVAAIEQQLSDIDAGMAGLERVLVNLKRYRAAVLQAACEGRLVPTEAEIARGEGRSYETGEVLLQRILTARRAQWEEKQLTKMAAKGQVPSDDEWKSKYEEAYEPDTAGVAASPDGWTWATMDALLDTIQAGASFKCDERRPEAGEIGVVKVSAVTWGAYDEAESKTCVDASRVDTSLFVKPGDFLFSRANTIDLVGACVIAEHVTAQIMLSDKILRFGLVGSESRWVLYMLRSRQGRHDIERLSTGNQESMRNIGQDRIRQIRIPIPPLTEQRRIVAEVDRLLSIAEATEQATRAQLARAKRLRQAVLKLAFEGKLVPQLAGEDAIDLLASPTNASSQPIKKSPTKTNGAAPTMRPRTPKPPEHPNGFRPLEDVLAAHASPMTPEALFSAAGYVADHVDDFYTELRRLELAGKIEEVRSAARLIRLRKATS